MKYFRFSCVLLYLGCLSLVLVDTRAARTKRNRHRQHNNLDWTAWTEWSSCTAQCGTGAAFRERQCIDRRQRAYSNKCHGKRHQFKICNTQECGQGEQPLREQLCSKHDNDIRGGKRYRWLPYLLHSARCELTCKASGHGFYNSFPDPIINGTICNKEGSSVCVEGVCKKFGCDGIVGSKAEKDVCGICNGDNSKCKMIHDVFDQNAPDLKYGYNLVTIIPSGATSVNVTQLRSGRNYLALKYRDGKFIINGHRRLSSVGKYEAAGTTFTYKNRASKHCPGECLLADGPTNKDLEIMLLYFGRNNGIVYQFGYPIDQNGMLKYQDLPLKDNSDNSVRIENDISRQISGSGNSQSQYDENGNYIIGNRDSRRYNNRNENRNTNRNRNRNSDRNRNTNRNNNRNTNRQEIRNTNRQGTRDINANLNRNRNRNRNRDNQRYTNNRNLPNERYDATVVIQESESIPNRQRPEDKMEKSYYVTSLSGISKLPGYTQSFTFIDKMKAKMHKNGINRILGNGQNDPMYPESDRGRGNQALSDRNGGRPIIVSNPIDPETIPVIYSWKVIGYTDCNRTCGSGVKQPIISCMRDAKEVSDKYCRKLNRPNESPLECNIQPCQASWEASPWTACSVSCDEGIQIRNISCLKEVSGSLFLESPLEECSHLTAPNTSQSCNLRDCFSWTASAWSQCSSNCGQGVRVRTVNCTSADGYYLNDLYCNRTDMPPEEESCYSSSCDNRYTSAWHFTNWQDECPVTCGSGKQRRRVICVSENPYGPDCDERDKPDDERACQARERCNGYWFSGPWKQCNSTCGEGIKTRDVLCLRPNGNTAYEIIPDDYCNIADRPVDFDICRSSPCPPEWFMSEWGECSVTCDKGQRSREVLCINTEHREVNTCDNSVKPSSTEECGTTPCNSFQSDSCRDTYSSCALVVRVGMCSNEGYRNVCCQSCSSQG